MKQLHDRRMVRWLRLAVAAALGVMVWGALFLIAPVWQWPTQAAAYQPLTSAEEPEPPTKETAPVDINTASAQELEQLPGIGPVKAQAIVAYRDEHGPFADLQELDEVYGISARMVEDWAGLAIAGQ